MLVKSTLPIDTWRDIYKLFVHPAGMYVAGEVQIVGIAEPNYIIMPPGIADSTGPIYAGIADVATFAFNATNHIVQQILPQQQTFTLAPLQLGHFQGGNMTLQEFDNNFDTLAEVANAGSQTFDEDDLVYCTAGSLPARSITNVAVPYMGLNFNIPGNATYPGSEGYSLQFYCDQNSQIQNFHGV